MRRCRYSLPIFFSFPRTHASLTIQANHDVFPHANVTFQCEYACTPAHVCKLHIGKNTPNSPRVSVCCSISVAICLSVLLGLRGYTCILINELGILIILPPPTNPSAISDDSILQITSDLLSKSDVNNLSTTSECFHNSEFDISLSDFFRYSIRL